MTVEFSWGTLTNKEWAWIQEQVFARDDMEKFLNILMHPAEFVNVEDVERELRTLGIPPK